MHEHHEPLLNTSVCHICMHLHLLMYTCVLSFTNSLSVYTIFLYQIHHMVRTVHRHFASLFLFIRIHNVLMQGSVVSHQICNRHFQHSGVAGFCSYVRGDAASMRVCICGYMRGNAKKHGHHARMNAKRYMGRREKKSRKGKMIEMLCA